jgi:arabinogalactan endo-1,4-beta-galactosidase
MQRRNRRRIRHQEKAVFVLDANAQNRNNLKEDDVYNYVSKMIDLMLRKSGIATDVVFVGGSKIDLCIWLSGILSFYQYNDIEIQDKTHLFDLDPDFDMPDNYR